MKNYKIPTKQSISLKKTKKKYVTPKILITSFHEGLKEENIQILRMKSKLFFKVCPYGREQNTC